MAQLSATVGILVTLAQTLTVPPPSPRPTVPSFPGGAQVSTFEQLFAPTAPMTSPQRAVVRTGPRVVCGMRVVPADPAVDPGILRPVPTDVTFAMRMIAPPICVD